MCECVYISVVFSPSSVCLSEEGVTREWDLSVFKRLCIYCKIRSGSLCASVCAVCVCE